MKRMATQLGLLFSMAVLIALTFCSNTVVAQANSAKKSFLIRVDDDLIRALKNGEALLSEIPPNMTFDQVKIVYEPSTNVPNNPDTGSGRAPNSGAPNSGIPNSGSFQNNSPNTNGFGGDSFGNNNGQLNPNNRTDSNQVPVIPRDNASGGSFGNPNNSGTFQPRPATQVPDSQLYGNQNAGSTARNPGTAPWEMNLNNNPGNNNTNGTGSGTNNNQAPNLYNQNNSGFNNTGNPATLRQPSTLPAFDSNNGDTRNQLNTGWNNQNVALDPPFNGNPPYSPSVGNFQANSGQFNSVQNPNNQQLLANQQNQQLLDELNKSRNLNQQLSNELYQMQNQITQLARKQTINEGLQTPALSNTLPNNQNAIANNSVGFQQRVEQAPVASIPGSNNEGGDASVETPVGQIVSDKLVYFLWFMLMFSIGLNFYLGWISRSFYVRYRELADELRDTFSSSI